MQGRWILAVVFLMLSAGCLEAEKESGGAGVKKAAGRPVALTPGTVDPVLERTLIHGVDGKLYSNESFPFKLPVVEQKYVGGINGVEPTVAVLPSGSAFYVGVDPLLWPQVHRSTDFGATWRDVSPKVGGVVTFPPATFDPFIESDPVTGRVFSIDLGPTVDCSVVQWSDNEGQSWQTTTTNTCGSRTSHDHQSLTTGVPRVLKTNGYPNMVYYCVNRGAAWCYTSLDGGRTLQPPVNTGLRYCGGLTGHLVTASDGTVYLPQIGCRNSAAENGTWIAISKDDGQKWEVVRVDASYPVARNFTNSHEGNVAVDAAGNVYYFFLDHKNLPTLTVSRDGGYHWSTPRNVAAPGVTATTLASIAAGDEGRVALLYIGTTAPGGHRPASPSTATWNAYVSITHNALDAEPVFVTTTANPLSDPLKRGTCTGRCMGNGPAPAYTFDGMYDFLDIDVDPKTGRVWAALVDMCNDACGRAGATDQSPQEGRAAVAVQVAGTTLKGLDL